MVARNFDGGHRSTVTLEHDESNVVVSLALDGVRFVRADIAETRAKGAEIRHGLQLSTAKARGTTIGIWIGFAIVTLTRVVCHFID